MDGVDEEVDEGEETHGEGGEDHGIEYSKTPPTTPTGMPSKICPKDNRTNQSTSKSTSPLKKKLSNLTLKPLPHSLTRALKMWSSC